MEISFVALKNFLEHIEITYGVRLHFYTYFECGFIDTSLNQTISNYISHDCDYCMYIKSNKLLWNKCIRLKNHVMKKCENEKGFFTGVCHAGVKEYIMPLFYKDTLIGYVSAGGYKNPLFKAEKIFSALSYEYGMDKDVLKGKYTNLINIANPEIDMIRNFLALIAEYIINAVSALVEVYNYDFSTKAVSSKKNNIMHLAMEFITKNMDSEIIVNDISQYCCCSASYLQHIFKKYMGVSITKYVNNLRIEKAKFFLARTDLPVTEIATKVGFDDPNYFSKYFRVACDISPTGYRKKHLTV